MTPDPWSQWPADPGPFLVLGGLVVWYAVAVTRFRPELVALGGPIPTWTGPGMRGPERRGDLSPWHVVRFFAGVVIAAFALGSPLHSVGESYLLTAHMAQHLIVTLVVPPLLITGIPAWMIRPVLTWAPIAPLVKVLLSPVPAFLIFNGVFLCWHAPAFYELALAVPAVHAHRPLWPHVADVDRALPDVRTRAANHVVDGNPGPNRRRSRHVATRRTGVLCGAKRGLLRLGREARRL